MNATYAQPRPGTVLDRDGKVCPRASTNPYQSSFPLSARCTSCGTVIACADESADWYHRLTLRGRCTS